MATNKWNIKTQHYWPIVDQLQNAKQQVPDTGTHAV